MSLSNLVDFAVFSRLLQRQLALELGSLLPPVGALLVARALELGQLHSDGQVDFPQFAIASVMADESDVEALLQGNTNVELIQDSVLEIAFSSPVPVSLLKTEVSVAAPSRITVEVKTGDDAWTEWETSTLAAGKECKKCLMAQRRTINLR